MVTPRPDFDPVFDPDPRPDQDSIFMILAPFFTPIPSLIGVGIRVGSRKMEIGAGIGVGSLECRKSRWGMGGGNGKMG